MIILWCSSWQSDGSAQLHRILIAVMSQKQCNVLYFPLIHCYSQLGEKLRTDTFGRNNAHPVSRECEGALCSVTHAPERRKIEDHWPGKFPQNNALFYCYLNSKQEVRLHHDIKFLLLLGNFSIAQAFFAFQTRLSRYCITLGVRSFVKDYF